MEGLISWFSKNHVAANFLMALVVLLGLVTWPTIKKEIFPETAIDTVLISVPFPNAAPEEVEKGILIPIEEALQDLDGVKSVRSTAAQSLGTIQVEAANNVKIRDLMNDIKSRIDAISNLAEEAEEPILEQLMIKNQVISLAISAATTEETIRDLADQIRTSLLNYEGGEARITQIKIAGVRDYEISIEISEDRLRQYNLSFDQVSAAVKRSSFDLPGGSVRTASGEVLLRTEARKYTAEQFSDITVVKLPDGSKVKLGQVAFIRDAFKQGDIDTRFNGRSALLLNVMRVGNEDTLEIANTVKNWVATEAPKILPPGVQLEIWRDDSLFLKGRLDLMIRNGLAGLILVSLVLAVFLRPSLAFLVALGIPVSFCGAVMLMPYTGISINLISLFAFILVLGIVVDDAIVVGENVYRRMRLGEAPSVAAPKGTHEVGVIVVFGIFTTIVAFTPMLGLSGIMGKIWPNIPLIVIPTLIFSLLQSKLILPSHLSMLKPYDPERKKGAVMRFQEFFSRGLEKFVDIIYRPILRATLNFRWVVFTGFVCLLLVCVSYVRNGHIRFEYLPEVEGDILTAKLQMSEGVPFEVTQRAINQLTRSGYQLGEQYGDRDGNPVTKNILAVCGSQPFAVLGFEGVDGTPTGTNLGEVTIELEPAANRDCNTEELLSSWRELTGELPGAVELLYQTETATGENAIDIELTGSNFADLKAATEELKLALGNIEGVIEISDNDRLGKRELKLGILPAAEALGIRLSDLANQVRQGFFGDEIQRLQRGKEEVIVYVRYPREERKSIADLQRTKIRAPDGSEVPFSMVATATFGRSASQINRSEGQRSITINADVDKAKGANANEIVATLNRGMESYLQTWINNFKNKVRKCFGKEVKETEEGVIKSMLQHYPEIKIIFQGEQKDQLESISEMGKKAALAFLAMYILMAIPLRSYFQPIIIMSVIPFGLIGAIAGHIIMRYDLSVISLCGITALSGVVVNDSLVLVDYVNRERRNGKTIVVAAWEAGAVRFRPILLTSLTTFAGLTPMLLASDLQARFLIPMAISLSFGILFATAITLILVPCVYLMLNDFRRACKYAFS